MEKLTFNFDRGLDQLLDASGTCIFSGYSTMGYKPVELDNRALDVKQVVALKESGFDAKEIIEMHKAGAI